MLLLRAVLAFLSIALLLAVPLPNELRAAKCDDAAFIKDVKVVKTWTELHRLARKFRSCPDDGLFGEAYSDLVVHILATKWTTLPQLVRLTEEDPPFRSFVLKHIDVTADKKDLADVLHKAETVCPAHHLALCRDIAANAKQALAQQKAVR